MEVKELAPKMISSPEDSVPLLADFANMKEEHFIVITLDGSHSLIKVHDITKGILNKTLTHPREVFRCAIIDSSASIIVAHNHPSGKNKPSKEDLDLTYRIKEAGNILGIDVLDHIIVSLEGYYSMLEHGDI
jgi:DNA repair protein RadC